MRQRAPFRGGDLKHPITFIRKNVTGQDSLGQDTQGDPIVVCTAWAQIQQKSGRELFQSQERWQELYWEVTTRYIPGIDPSMDIQSDEYGYLDIQTVVDPDGTYRYLFMVCRKRILDGGKDTF